VGPFSSFHCLHRIALDGIGRDEFQLESRGSQRRFAV
jgi:hypothetical protein